MLIPSHQSLQDRQIAFCICAGFPVLIAAEALGLAESTYRSKRWAVIKSYGFDNAVEFAINVNAAVRCRANGASVV